MSTTSITMMIITTSFYGIGLVYLLNKAFNAKKNR